MKKYRFIPFFFVCALILSLCALPAAALEDPAPQHCKAAIVVDGDWDEVLYSFNAEERMYPASITKIMTSLLVMEAIADGRLSLDQQVTASETAVVLPEGSSTAGIKAGEVLTVEELLYCDLVASANEACNILAETVGGTIPDFVVMMNDKAQELGMKNTHFVNPHGLHDEDHYTTALDITIMARAAMEYETFREIVSTTLHTVPATNLSPERVLHTTNYLLSSAIIPGYTYSKAIGIKTGSTTPAGQCLASAAQDGDGRTYYCVVLGAETVENEDGSRTRYSFAESKRLLEWAFENYRHITLLDETNAGAIREIPVTLSDKGDHVTVQPVGSIEATMPRDYDPARAELRMALPESVEAPVKQGDKLGTVTFVYDGREYGTLDMAAAFDVERSELQYQLKTWRDILDQWWVKAAIVGVAVLALLIVIVVAVAARRGRRRRYGRPGSRSGRRNYTGR